MINADEIRRYALNPPMMDLRHALARYTSQVFHEVGERLHVFGHIIGDDRRKGVSPFGHGDDETVAISLLLRIGSELIAASADLIREARNYSALPLFGSLSKSSI